MKRDLGKWRDKTPNQHRSYGEKRNRDEMQYLNFCLKEIENEIVIPANNQIKQMR